MRRFVIIVSSAVVIATIGPSPALARGPKWEYQPFAPTRLGVQYCGVPIEVALVVDKEYTEVTTTSDGATVYLTTGYATARFTNLRTGTSVTVNSSGPARATFYPDGSAVIKQYGHIAQFFPADLAATLGVPPVYLWMGRHVFRFGPGSPLTFSKQGHLLMNICEALT